jgi:hypothetical protein
MGGQRPALTGDLDSMIAPYNSIGAMLVAQWGPLSDAVHARTYGDVQIMFLF